MNITESFNRLIKTISGGHKPNDTDKIALNRIIVDFNNQSNGEAKESALLAKLYAIVLRDFAVTYKSIDNAQERLNIELKTPLSTHLDRLKMQFKNTETLEFFSSKGVTDPHLRMNNFNEYKALFKQIDPNEFKAVTERWDDEKTASNFEFQLKQSVNLYQNHE